MQVANVLLSEQQLIFSRVYSLRKNAFWNVHFFQLCEISNQLSTPSKQQKFDRSSPLHLWSFLGFVRHYTDVTVHNIWTEFDHAALILKCTKAKLILDRRPSPLVSSQSVQTKNWSRDFLKKTGHEKGRGASNLIQFSETFNLVKSQALQLRTNIYRNSSNAYEIKLLQIGSKQVEEENRAERVEMTFFQEHPCHLQLCRKVSRTLNGSPVQLGEFWKNWILSKRFYWSW